MKAITATLILLFSIAAGLAAGAAELEVGHVPFQAGCREVSVRDRVIEPGQPEIPGEQYVLSTIGTLDVCSRQDGDFQPLVSFLLDRTFPEAPRDEWLAMWNLGRKSPGWLSRARAAFPMFLANKKARGRELRGLEKKLRKFEADPERVRDIPKPHLHVNDRHRRSKAGLVLSSVKQGLGFGLRRSGLDHIAFPVQVFYRNYLLRSRDLQTREFEHGYLGLLWYDDLARGGQELALHPEWVEEIKFRLLADRSIFGSWVDNSQRQHLVHGFESEMRDHLWGTSCYLASVANLHHLGYQEIHRYTATGVPLALGGILYYDPELAPEPSQVQWAVLNPFDLTYNPFRDYEVQRAARGGKRVPLALYVYQSNLALKPIIAIDFFRPDNPRLREAATYWRRLGNETLASAGSIGWIYQLLRRSSDFAVNRKGITWLTDQKVALGLEELRLSLVSNLYFEPEEADELLEELERTLINPLVQPGKVQRLRARVHYQRLLAGEGEKLVERARRLRDKKIRRTLGLESPRLTAEDYSRYRRHLEAREAGRTLQLYLAESHLSGIPLPRLEESLELLAGEARLEDEELLETLQRFRQRAEEESRFAGAETSQQGSRLLARADRTLLEMYSRSGQGEPELRADLAEARARWAERAEQMREDEQKRVADRFVHLLKKQLKVLEGFNRSEGDLELYSPWYVADALDFFSRVPQVLESNALARQRYQRFAERVETSLTRARRQLAARDEDDPLWLDLGRQRSLDLAEAAERNLLEQPARAAVVEGEQQ